MNATPQALAARWLAEAPNVLLLAGAGMSADSGIPTAEDATEYCGMDAHELASQEGFRHVPRMSWGYYGARIGVARFAQVHAGHRALRRLERVRRLEVITTNVDGLLHRGLLTPEVIELNGSLRHLHCPGCARRYRSHALIPPVSEETGEWVGDLPTCGCGSLLRPNVRLYNEHLWPGSLEEEERMKRQSRAIVAGPERWLILEVGAGTRHPVLRALSSMLHQVGAHVVRITRHAEPAEAGCSLVLEGRASELLPMLVAAAGM